MHKLINPKTKLYQTVKGLMLSDEFPWYYSKHVSMPDSDDGTYFQHQLYIAFKQSNYFSMVSPIMDKLDAKGLHRCKANLYPRTPEIYHHGKHVDYDFKHKGFIYYVNTNNGLTILDDGTEIKSVENRGLFLDSTLEHSSTTCTDQPVRININFNYF